MEKLTRSESRSLYSWWWTSHISPKNSKWLQENLADMDNKIKEMIKLVDDDADTFARRADMFYKKRPELIKLVEEFYRMYRALAERHDHATRAPRQGHQTMAEALTDEISPPIHELFDDFQKDGLGGSSHLNEMLAAGEETTYPNTTEEGARQGLDIQEEQGNVSEYKPLEAEISRLLMENQELERRIMSESVRASRAEIAVQSLKDILPELKSEKEAAILQFQQTVERMASLEMEVSCSREDIRKLNNEMLMGAKNLNVAQEKCLLLEKANQSLELELKQIIEKHEDEKFTHLQNLKQMELLSEKNALLVNSLSNADVELEKLREKIKTLENSCGCFCGKSSIHPSEKAVLISQVETTLQQMAKHLEKNTLENSQSDVKIKLEDLRGKLEGLEVQRKVLKEDITLGNVCLDELKEKLEAQERENRELKTHLAAYVPLVMSSWANVTLLEQCILMLANHSSKEKQEIQEVPLVPLQSKKSSQEPIKDDSAIDLTGILKLQQLHAKVEALQKVVMDTGNLLRRERFDSDANLQAARKEIECLKSKGTSDDHITKVNNEQNMKDIQLELVSHSSQSRIGNNVGSYGQRKTGNAKTNDEGLEVRGRAEGDHSNQIEITPSGTMEHVSTLFEDCWMKRSWPSTSRRSYQKTL